MNIYIDMDEVVADWLSTAKKHIGDWDPDATRVPQSQWRKLLDYPRMYRELEVRRGGRELVEWVMNYQRTHDDVFVAFLTAVPSGNDVPWAFQDKVHWANFYFPGIPVFFGPYSEDKQVHCLPGDILIDDRHVNGVAWTAAGGRFCLYKEWTECKLWLEETLK
jgi:5'(3')-deoxyribonucleotidase